MLVSSFQNVLCPLYVKCFWNCVRDTCVTRAAKSRILRWAGHVAHMGTRKINDFLVAVKSTQERCHWTE